MKRILITGASGFSAAHLYAELIARGAGDILIYGIDRSSGRGPEGLDVRTCDMLDEQTLGRVIDDLRPDDVYHLSGTFTNQYAEDYAGNVLATLNLLNAVMAIGQTYANRCRILLVGSAAEYGASDANGEPISEGSPLRPTSIYGITKVFQTQLAQFFHRVHGLHTVLVRPFNLIGPGISKRLFIGNLYAQALSVCRASSKRIELGNLDSSRDYLDVRDAVRAYVIALERGVPGEIYNVGRGRLTPIGEILELFLERFGINRSAVQSHDSAKEKDRSCIYADISKLRSLGWHPEIQIEQSVASFPR